MTGRKRNMEIFFSLTRALKASNFINYFSSSSHSLSRAPRVREAFLKYDTDDETWFISGAPAEPNWPAALCPLLKLRLKFFQSKKITESSTVNFKQTKMKLYHHLFLCSTSLQQQHRRRKFSWFSFSWCFYYMIHTHTQHSIEVSERELEKFINIHMRHDGSEWASEREERKQCGIWRKTDGL